MTETGSAAFALEPRMMEIAVTPSPRIISTAITMATIRTTHFFFSSLESFFFSVLSFNNVVISPHHDEY